MCGIKSSVFCQDQGIKNVKPYTVVIIFLHGTLVYDGVISSLYNKFTHALHIFACLLAMLGTITVEHVVLVPTDK